jgi:hypothetical protein
MLNDPYYLAAGRAIIRCSVSYRSMAQSRQTGPISLSMYLRWRDSPHSKHSPTSGNGVLIIILVEAVTTRSRAEGYADLADFTWSQTYRSKNYDGY